MRTLFLFASLALLVSCDAPSPDMRGAITRKVIVEGSEFTVHRKGDRAEAIRTNFEYGRKARGIMARGHAAIETATGCRIVQGSYSGDPAMMKARLNCTDGG